MNLGGIDMTDNFCWAEGHCSVTNIIKQLTTVLTTCKDECKWSLEYPSALSNITDTAILKTSISDKDAFVKFQRPTDVLNYMFVTIGKAIVTNENNTKDLEPTMSSEPARFAWYKTDSNFELFDWTAIQYWLSFGKDFINIVLQGDPSIDTEPYNNYLISYGYIGAVESFENSQEDIAGNFGLTVSSDVLPTDSEKYGDKTANGVTDMSMFETRLNAPFQSHFIKFSTEWAFTEKHFIEASHWTNKHHMSEIILWHPYDRERGKFKNVLIGDRSAINHSDILMEEVQQQDGTKLTKKYIMLNINAPYSILNNSPNVMYGIALRKE